MVKQVVKQLNTNVSEDLVGRIERYVYENKGKKKVSKTSVVVRALDKFLKSEGY